MQWAKPTGEDISGYKVYVAGLPPQCAGLQTAAWIRRAVRAGQWHAEIGRLDDLGRPVADPLVNDFPRDPLSCITDVNVYVASESGAS
eukprot:11478113-Alexandrium_andersonii.AAC.1